MEDSERIYLGHDNVISIILTEDGEALTTAQMAAINRMTLLFDDTVIDSNVAGEGVGQPFDWTAGDGVVTFDLADQTIAAGNYRAELIVHSTDNSDGIVWGKIRIKVVEIDYTPYTP